jgi:predicted nucleic acid-binding protein
MRAGPPEGYLHVLDFFQRFPHLSYLAVDLPVAQEAASLRAHFGFGVADALTIAAALVGQTSYIVSADRAWVSKLNAIQTRVKLICLS